MSATFDPRQYLADFVSEAGEHLATFIELLGLAERQLMAGRALDETTVHRLFRAVHTLKGMAGMLNFSATVTLSHEIEGVLEAVRAGKRKLVVEEVQALLEVADVLGRLLERIAASGDEDGVDVLPSQGLLIRLSRGELVPVAAPDYLDRLDPHDQMAILVDVARGERLFNVHFAGTDFVGFVAAARALGRLLGLWDADARPLAEDARPVTGVDALVLAPEGSTTADVARALAAEHVAEAPLPWQAAPIPAPAAPADGRRRLSAITAGAAPPAVRVETDRLDRMGGLAGELATTLAGLESIVAALPPDQAQRLAEGLAEASRRARTLDSELSATRRVAAATLFGRFQRPVRELARATGKWVRLEVMGGDVMLDKDTADRLVEPLMHLLRNTVDHGLELPADRTAAGKPTQGVIALSAAMEGDGLAIGVSDDGRGLDRLALVEKAIEDGRLAAGATPTDAEIDALIFQPGLSTARQTGEISGRGVGMDAVRASLERLGGRVEVSTRPGRGTRFKLILPSR